MSRQGLNIEGQERAGKGMTLMTRKGEENKNQNAQRETKWKDGCLIYDNFDLLRIW